jgi:hypothetical protein
MREDVMGRRKSPSETPAAVRSTRPEHFSTYVPRRLVRRLKLVATIRDVPLWSLVTAALEDYLDAFQKQYGRLPEMDDEPAGKRE